MASNCIDCGLHLMPGSAFWIVHLDGDAHEGPLCLTCKDRRQAKARSKCLPVAVGADFPRPAATADDYVI